MRKLAPAVNINNLSLDPEGAPVDDPPSHVHQSGSVNKESEEHVYEDLSTERQGLSFDCTDDYDDYYDYEDDDYEEDEVDEDDVKMAASLPTEVCSYLTHSVLHESESDSVLLQ